MDHTTSVVKTTHLLVNVSIQLYTYEYQFDMCHPNLLHFLQPMVPPPFWNKGDWWES